MGGLLPQAAALLHSSGGRMTSQRRLILETLDAIGGHPTAEEVYRAARQRDASVNPSTVYRTLGWLTGAGLISPRRLGAESKDRRHEKYDPASPTEHHHFVCTSCGRVIEFESPRIEMAKAEFSGRYHATVDLASLTLYGLCDRCAGAPAGKRMSSTR